MIRRLVKYYRDCCEDLTNIEGFIEAVNDRSDIHSKYQNWVLHHRLETHDSDGNKRPVQLSADELKELGMYYNRPACELIFLTKAEHNKIHTEGRILSCEHVNKMVTKRKIPVRCIELDKVFPSMKEAAEFINKKSVGGIHGCCNGYYKTAGGYHWEYAVDKEEVKNLRKSLESKLYVMFTRSDGESHTITDWEFIGFNPSGIYRSIETGKLYKGYAWSRVERNFEDDKEDSKSNTIEEESV